MNTKISLCMIVKNESALIADCVQRATKVCSQCVVVDTGSTDDTIALARNAGAEVYEHPWPGHFSIARNISLEYATGDWILILDGDELLDNETLDWFEHFSPSESDNAFDFTIVNYSTDDASESSAHFQKQVRIFRNKPNHRYAGLIHNQLVDTATGLVLNGPQVPVRVLHYGYTPSVWAAQNKAGRLEMLEKAIRDEPNSLFCHYNLANHLKILEEYARALAHYVPCFDGDPEQVWVQMSFFSAAYCANQIGQHELAIECCEKLLEIRPEVADAHLRRAEALLGLERPDLVIDLVAPILGHPDLFAFKTQVLSFTLPYRLGRAYFLTQQFNDAYAIFESISHDTNDVTVFTHMCLCALHLGDIKSAEAAATRGIELDPTEPDWVKLQELIKQQKTARQS